LKDAGENENMRKWTNLILVVLCILGFGVLPAQAYESVTIESLLLEMVDRDSIACFPNPEFRLKQDSSYNRASLTPEAPRQDPKGWFMNHDYNSSDRDKNFIRIEENKGRKEWVLMEDEGAGAIVRSWMPWQSQGRSTTTTIIRFYLDGAAEPVIEGNQFELFQGKGLIPFPLAHESLRSAVSFFPIPYAKRCKVTVSERPFFFQFTYREYPDETPVRTFTMAEFNAAKATIDTICTSLLNPKRVEQGKTVCLAETLARHAEKTVDLPQGAAAIRSLSVTLGNYADPAVTRSVVLMMSFDGHDTVWCPIGDFFGSGIGLNPFQGWYRTVAEEGTLLSRWVMPYRESARLSIVNLGNQPVDIRLDATIGSWQWDDRSMYFNAAWHGQYPVPTRPFSDWNYVTLKGRGVYVGDTLTIMNPVEKWWGEGDEKIFVDGEAFPSLFGTGTEDYYAYSWGGRSTDFYEHPFHAQPFCHVYNKLNRKASANERNTRGYSTETRTRALDTMPFGTSLQLDMEVWSGTDCDMAYGVGAYWYGFAATTSNRKPDPVGVALTGGIGTHANLNRLEADVIIYGGTAAAVIAAVQVKHMGKSVIVVSPDKHLGGLTAGGLGWTDVGNKSVIGGFSREFYERVWQHYSQPKAWKWQASSDYSKASVGSRVMDTDHSMWIFEPSVAERIFEEYISENNIPVYRDEWLNRKTGVEKDGQRICSMTTLSGRQYQGKVFIDATYEGDLMACAGVRYHVGREANSVYDETWNGIQIGTLHHDHHFGDTKVSPYKEPGNPASGLLPRISAQDPGKKGEGDSRVQAYCFRMCLTDHPDNRIPFAKPQGYDPNQYELLARIFDSGWRDVFRKFDPIPNRKTDTNNHGPFSTDNIGMNYDYPDASYERRREIIKEHEIYQKGLMYFLANDSKVPVDIRTRMNQWGLARDEFVDNGHWPHQLYIREARRMIGDYVTTENDIQGKRQPPKPIGKGSYTMDSHNVQRYIQPNGFVQNEGDIGVHPKKPYQIAYGSIIPKKDECENLLVPVCVSSSHIAYGSIRMEPVFMILGQSAGTAACLALDENVAVQDVDYEILRKQLLADKQRL
jgi:hypothetical protein